MYVGEILQTDSLSSPIRCLGNSEPFLNLSNKLLLLPYVGPNQTAFLFGHGGIFSMLPAGIP